MYELHDFARSSAAYRVRIALALKKIDYTSVPVDLVGGVQHEQAYRSINPQGLVPVYSDDRILLSQSLAIIEYLDERYPDPPLLPDDLEQRARARQFAQIIVSDIHPLNGFRVHTYLRDALGVAAGARRKWFHYWLLEGLDALELWLAAKGSAKRYCVGELPSIADICLIPQLDVARRNRIDIDEFPRLAAVETSCLALDAFRLTRDEPLVTG